MYDCVVPGCKAKGVHNFPRNEQLRKLWEITANMKESKIYSATRPCKICSTHFKPSDYFKEGFYTGVKNKKRVLRKNVVPSRFPWNTKKKSLLKKMGIDVDKKEEPSDNTEKTEASGEKNGASSEVTQDQDKNVEKMDQDPLYMPSTNSAVQQNQDIPFLQMEVAVEIEDVSTNPTASLTQGEEVGKIEVLCSELSETVPANIQDNITAKVDEAPPAIPAVSQIQHIKITESQILEAIQTEVKQDKTELRIVKQKSKQLISVERFKNDPTEILSYTGMESFEKFIAVFETLGTEAYMLQSRRNVISSEDQFFLTLIKLRQNIEDDKLAKLFTITPAVATNIFITWVDFLYEKWKMIKLSPERVEILVSPEDYLSQLDRHANEAQKESNKKGKGKKGDKAKSKKKSEEISLPIVPDKIPEGVSKTYTILLSTDTIKHVSRPKLYLVCKILCCFIDNTLNPLLYHNRVTN